MTKQRDPETYAGCIDLMVREIGEDASVNAVNVSSGAIRVWRDPDRPTLPNVEQATELGRAYQRITGLESPLHKLATRRLADDPVGCSVDSPEEEALDVHFASGDLAGILRRARDANSPGGARLTPGEVMEINHHIAVLERQAAEFREACKNESENLMRRAG